MTATARRHDDDPLDVTESLDPWHAWMEAHPEEVKLHRGRFVAVHPELGIVAFASTPEVAERRALRVAPLDALLFTRIY